MKIKRTIMFAIICTLSLVSFGLGVSHGIKTVITKTNNETDNIQIISSEKELKKVLDSTKDDYNRKKVLIEGEILSTVTINKEEYYKNFIYVRKKTMDSNGKIIKEESNNSRFGTIYGVGINLSKILFMNPDIIYSDKKTETSAVLNGQKGTLMTHISLGEIRDGNFYSRKTAKEIINELKIDIDEILQAFYIFWSLLVIGFCIIPFTISIHYKYKKERMNKNDRNDKRLYNI